MKTLLLGLLTVLSLNAFAKEGGNGGDAVVTSDNAIRLRDLVDPGNCTWKSGKSVLAQKDLLSVLDRLSDANPYLAYRLKDQILNIKWCYTATLKKIDTNDDEETLTYYLDPYARNKIQAGIRVVNNVYIDRSIIAPNLVDGRMLQEDRPFFYIHEAMHAFLYMKTPNRNKRVRDAVKAIRDFYTGDTNADDFDSMIVGSELLAPTNDSNFVQPLMRILYDAKLTLEERIKLGREILAPNDTNNLLVQWKDINGFLTDDELSGLTKTTGLTRFEFFKRTRKEINIEENSLVTFKYSRIPEALTKTSFGKCQTILDKAETEAIRNGSGKNYVAVYDLRLKQDRLAHSRNEKREGMNWAVIKNLENNQTMIELPRNNIYTHNKYVFYDVEDSTKMAQIIEQLYTKSLCDFKPNK